MYTLRDVVAGNVTLLNETQLIELEEINAVTIKIKHDQKKVVKAHIGLHDYLFGGSLKSIVKAKVKKDLGSDFIFKFAI